MEGTCLRPPPPFVAPRRRDVPIRRLGWHSLPTPASSGPRGPTCRVQRQTTRLGAAGGPAWPENPRRDRAPGGRWTATQQTKQTELPPKTIEIADTKGEIRLDRGGYYGKSQPRSPRTAKEMKAADHVEDGKGRAMKEQADLFCRSRSCAVQPAGNGNRGREGIDRLAAVKAGKQEDPGSLIGRKSSRGQGDVESLPCLLSAVSKREVGKPADMMCDPQHLKR